MSEEEKLNYWEEKLRMRWLVYDFQRQEVSEAINNVMALLKEKIKKLEDQTSAQSVQST